VGSILKKTKVPCWELPELTDAVDPVIAYPESSMGYDLITCTSCGQIYAAEVSAQMYVEPLEKRLANLGCIKCEAALIDTCAAYPETYVDRYGRVRTHSRSLTIPDDKDAVLREFPSIY